MKLGPARCLISTLGLANADARLLQAVLLDNPAALQLLLAAGAKMDDVNNGRTPRSLAVELAKLACAKVGVAGWAAHAPFPALTVASL